MITIWPSGSPWGNTTGNMSSGSMNPSIPASSSPLSRRDWWIAAAVALAAGFVRALNGAHRGFWIDEYVTLRVTRLSARELILDRFSQGHSPLYFFYAKLGPLLGDSEWALRLTSVVMVVAAVLLLTGLVGALNLRAALPAVWAFALVSPFWFTIGTQYRYMMMLVALSALSGWLAAAYASSWQWWRGLLLGLSIGLILWIHASMQFFAVVLGVFLVWEAAAQTRRFGAKAIAMAWPVLLGLLLSVPQAFLIFAKKLHSLPGKPNMRVMLANVGETAFGNPLLWPRHFGVHPNVMLIPMMIVLLAALWLARRHLRAAGNARAWRLLASWFIGIPLLLVVYSIFFHRIRQEVRYVCTLSIPALILLAVAWRAAGAKTAQRAFRAAVAAIVIVQLAAVVIDRGDLHREAAQWLIRNHSGSEPVILASLPNNAFAMDYLGFKHPELLAGPPSPSLTKDELCTLIRDKLQGRGRAFFLFYYQSDAMWDAMQHLRKSGFFVEAREWRCSGLAILTAVALEPGQRTWLRGLPDPPRPWGPASGDNEYNPRFKKRKKY